MTRCYAFVLLLLATISHFHQDTVEAKPTNSMTRIQEVFRTLMSGPSGPRMVVSRGKKSFDRDEASEDERPIVLIPSEALRRSDDDGRQYAGAVSSDMVNPIELQQQPRLGSVVWMLHHKQSNENAY